MKTILKASSSAAKRRSKLIVKKSKFQLIVDLQGKKCIEHYLVLPAIFKNQIEKECSNITVIDSKGREYSVFVYDLGGQYVKIGHASWPLFAITNILGDLDISKLCFKLLANNVFEVMCFDSYGLEKIRERGERIVVKRCLIEASETTINEEYLPPDALVDMNQESHMKPHWKAEVIGPKQHAEADVIYEFDESKRDLEKWCAVGLKGVGWTNFVMMNGVDVDFLMMFTPMEKQRYIVDVFNQRGVGLGLIDSSTEGRPLEEEWKDVDSEDEDTDREFIHDCRVKKHKHKHVRNPYFLIRLPEVCLTHKMLTVPKYFVRKYNLQIYKGAVIVYGNMKFKARLDIKRDARRPDDLSHVVIGGDWGLFLKHSGFMVGEPIKFELNERKSEDRGKAYFYVC